MSVHGIAPVRQIAGAAGLLAILCAVSWRRLRAIVGSTNAAHAVILACIVGLLAWLALIALVRLLVRAVLS